MPTRARVFVALIACASISNMQDHQELRQFPITTQPSSCSGARSATSRTNEPATAPANGVLRGSKRKAQGRLVEGQTVTNWMKALEQLSLVYPERINRHL